MVQLYEIHSHLCSFREYILAFFSWISWDFSELAALLSIDLQPVSSLRGRELTGRMQPAGVEGEILVSRCSQDAGKSQPRSPCELFRTKNILHCGAGVQQGEDEATRGTSDRGFNSSGVGASNMQLRQSSAHPHCSCCYWTEQIPPVKPEWSPGTERPSSWILMGPHHRKSINLCEIFLYSCYYGTMYFLSTHVYRIYSLACGIFNSLRHSTIEAAQMFAVHTPGLDLIHIYRPRFHFTIISIPKNKKNCFYITKAWLN